MGAVLRFLTWQRAPVSQLRMDRPRFERSLLLAYSIALPAISSLFHIMTSNLGR